MARKFRDFMIGGMALLPCLLWLFTGSTEVFAVTASLMLLSTIIVAMAMPPSADPPEDPH